MAKKKGGKKDDGKKQVKNKVPSNKYKAYKVTGDTLERIQKTCPKCGPGVFMAAHKNRNYCGKCEFTEFKN
ncbi:30S ribosomal protein S27ae [Candidatus Woesearchaeota archaeon]|jgi:ubiquitin-small subunit ribosomal protein S27Ae|nr:30S ribosomal protein S27ae [Candidatus Woesearchaeota archaeon]MBT4387995.1 30S ribosomal protein S27ae [Candidatus Woesearchaeota archaeon]MBT4595339.1 30S ribosomal protein S27ae [Candidatus Woesearchaeota archaeon]MBT5741256.1 30S ribosomal protein S27ae [Candidatus Woesearchaeota archaeon]MBT6505848.1 30S ribosomal protein S27ae [Candidatus Woesearchaeota archaeon]